MILDVITRTLTRVLTVLACMGYLLMDITFIYRLGISRANITDITCKLVVFAISFFIVNFWDSYLSIQSSLAPTTAKLRIYITAGYLYE